MKKHLFLLFISITTSLPAVVGSWTGGGATNLWSNAANWAEGNIPQNAGDTAILNDNNIDQADVDVNLSLTRIEIPNSTNFGLIGSNQITFTEANSSLVIENDSFLHFGQEVGLITNTDLLFDIRDNSACMFSQNSRGISGTGNLIKEGSGFVNFERRINYSGTTQINSGSLVANDGMDTSSITINNGAQLQAKGNINGHVENNGVLVTGFSTDDILTVDSYEQTAIGLLVLGLNPNTSSSLTVTNAATIDGVLFLHFEPGVYSTDTEWQIIKAGDGQLSGEFAHINEDHELSFNLAYNGTTAILRPVASTSPDKGNPTNVIVAPIPLTQLDGTAHSLGNYMLNSDFVSSSEDLLTVTNQLLAVPASQYPEALATLTPLANAALPQASFQTDMQMAIVLDRQMNQTMNKVNKHKKEDPDNYPYYGIPNTGVFIEPIGVFYRQHSTGSIANQGQLPFNSYTYGVGVGGELVLNGQFVAELGVGYTHSNLHWLNNFGNSRWSTIYYAPFFGWFSEKAFVNFMAMGAVNYIQMERKILFQNFDRRAKSRFKSYDILLRSNSGIRIPLGKRWWFQPDFTFNYLIIFTESFTETGAGSINLEVRNNRTFAVQPSIRGRFIKEFMTKKACYAPNLYLGWLSNINDGGQLSSRFEGAPNRIFFNTQGYNDTINQLVVGAELYIQKFNAFELTASFEADLLNRLEVYVSKIKFEWLF